MTTSWPVAGPHAAETDFLLEALRAAASVLARLALSPAMLNKNDLTPVTSADLSVQAVLAALLQRAFPDDVLVAEEDSETLRWPEVESLQTEVVEAVRVVLPEADPSLVLSWLDRGRGQPGPRFWTLDPVDGTKGLLRGGQYATALALIQDGEIVLGGLACPRYPVRAAANGGTFAVAVRRSGAWQARSPDGPWTRLAVSSETNPHNCRLLRSVESGSRTEAWLAEVRRALGTTAAEIRMDSQVKYLALAAGAGDLVVRLPRKQGKQRENIWDHATGVLMVEEAGGRCSDIEGRQLNFGAARQMERNLGVVASNGRLHEVALEALRRSMPTGWVEPKSGDAV